MTFAGSVLSGRVQVVFASNQCFLLRSRIAYSTPLAPANGAYTCKSMHSDVY